MAGPAVTLAHLTTVANARDLAGAVAGPSPPPPRRLAPATLFRAACPAGCAVSDVDVLVRGLAVRTLVDLRSPAERAADPPGCALMPPTPTTAPPTPLLVCTPIIEKEAFKTALLGCLPWPTRARVTVLSLVGARGAARGAALDGLNAGGLALLYRILLTAGAPGFGAAARAVTAGLEGRGGAVLFFCRLGKDRTGLLAALLLSVLGVGREAILADYALSEGVDPAAVGIALGGLEREEEGGGGGGGSTGIGLGGLDAATFAHAPPAALAAALDFLEAEHGSVGGYLGSTACGFGGDWQRRLVAAATTGAEGEGRARL